MQPLLQQFGVENWAYVDEAGTCHGANLRAVSEWFQLADAFIDYGAHRSWNGAATRVPMKVLIDGEPGFNQIKLEKNSAAGSATSQCDFYFTNGRNIGTAASRAPTAGRVWHHLFHTVNIDRHQVGVTVTGARFSTIMNW